MNKLRRHIKEVEQIIKELEIIDTSIQRLTVFGNELLKVDENNQPIFSQISVMMETLPASGALPMILPVYAMNNYGADTGNPIGFQRTYNPGQVQESLLNIEVHVDSRVILPVIDTMISSLKRERVIILQRYKVLTNRP